MSTAKLVKQVLVTTKNEAGEFFRVTSAIAEAKVNLIGICAWGMGSEAHFALLTNNNTKVLAALSAKGFQTKEQEAVTVLVEDKVGGSQAIAESIKKAGVSLDYVYGTSCGCKDSFALLVIVSKNNSKVLSCL